MDRSPLDTPTSNERASPNSFHTSSPHVPSPGQHLHADEQIARCAIHDRFLTGSADSDERVFSEERLLALSRDKGTPNHKTSVGWRKLLPGDADVHGYGCRSAAMSNFKNAEKGRVLVPTQGQAHYLGFYNIDVGAVLRHENEIYKTFVEEWPEEGEDAHCHIVLEEKDGLTKNQQKLKSHYRTEIITGLWGVMGNPSRHICDCDVAYIDTLSSIRLPPGGSR